MSGLRSMVRQAAYRSGALSLARAGVRHALTAVMFHRVLDPADPDYPQADPVYTISTPLFEQLLGFFHDHYAVVDLQGVLNAHAGTRKLPHNALLITFDDGWADNYRYAAPLLRARNMPAVIFVAAQAVQSDAKAWWQEEVFTLARAGRLDAWLAQAPMNRDGDPVEVVARLALMDAGERDGILANLPCMPSYSRMMMTGDELRRLADGGIAVGLHGSRHVPLTSLDDVRSELLEAGEILTSLTGGTAATSALGCPHGLYDDRVVAEARAVGIKLIFTSDKRLNATQDGMIMHPRPLGRIGIAAAHIEATPHRLDRAAAARWLWPRECN
jgi:peptidoglycan/xylan/chitin deacetylase (PgdA/CDA1 family)